MLDVQSKVNLFLFAFLPLAYAWVSFNRGSREDAEGI